MKLALRTPLAILIIAIAIAIAIAIVPEFTELGRLSYLVNTVTP